MGILFCAFLLLFRFLLSFSGGRRTVPGGRRPVPAGRRSGPAGRRPAAFQVCREDGPPGQNHPAAPARALRPGLSRPERVLPAPSHTERTRRVWLPQGTYPPMGSLRPVPWNVKDPPKKPLLSTCNTRMYFPSGTVYIPPLRRTFSRPLSSPERVVKCKMPVPSRTTPLPLPLTTRPPKTNRVVNSKCSPAPLDHGPKHPDSNLSEKARKYPKSSSSEGQGVTESRSPARDVLPPPPPAPTACSSLLPERPTKEVLGEDHPSSGPESPTSGKPTHSPQHSDMPSSSASLVADTLPVAADSGLVLATSAQSADLSARPLTTSAPTRLSLPVRGHSLPPPDSHHTLGMPRKKNGGRLHSTITSTSISGVSAPAMASTVSFQPPSCNNESPTPMCVDSPAPALPLPTPLPVPSASVPLALPTNSVAVPSTSARASANPTGQHTSDSDITEMDTTPPPPSKVLVVTASPSPGRRCPKPQVYCRIRSSTGPPAAKCPRLASNYTGGPQTTPQPGSNTGGAWNGKTSLVPAAVTTNSPVVNSAATHAPVNSSSGKPVDDTEAMDTTPAP